MNQSTPKRSWTESLQKAAAEAFPGLVGLWIAVALLKLGNPIILDNRIATPSSWVEAIYQPWPVLWGYLLFAAAFLTGLSVWKWRGNSPRLLVFTPVLWLAWQCVSSLQHVDAPDAKLIAATVPHFAVCVLAFYLGLFALSRMESSRAFWIGVAGAWFVVVCIGWRQHFGGLQEMRDYFHSLPNWRDQPPELIAKLASNRIYSTLVYPNALAGAIILFSPAIIAGLAYVSHGKRWLTRAIPPALGLAGALGCLVWSGSKGGWVIALGLAILALLLRARASSVRMFILCLLVIGGISGFWFRYQAYFERGATSISARFDYWKVALANIRERPVLGSGPGTFMNVYRRMKSPEAEMTRLVHNDYLEQATDSGIIGALLFGTLIAGSLVFGYRSVEGGGVHLGVWLGVVGVAIQCFSEFGLYIPALAWPWFLGMGALVGRVPGLKTVDKGSGSS